MIHLNETELRNLLDGESPELEADRARAHLERCGECRSRFRDLDRRSGRVETALSSAWAPDSEAAPSAEAAYRRFRDRYEPRQKEGNPMQTIFRSNRLRPVFAGVAVVAFLLALLAFPQVRAAAVDFLGLFRVQQIAVVEVNPGNLPEQLGTSNVFEDLISKNVTVEESGEAIQLADRAQALSQAGFPARLPLEDASGHEYRLQPGSRVTFEVDLPQVEQLVRDLGFGELNIPREVDGAEVVLTVHPSLVASFGECRMDEMFDERGEPLDIRFDGCTVLGQTPSPTIQAPAGLNLPEIGKSFLQVMGLSAQEAEEFSRTVDWTTTLVIPIPRYGTSYRTVDVDGVEGTLILQEFDDHQPSYLLIWVKDGVIYSVTGQGDWQDGIALGNSLK